MWWKAVGKICGLMSVWRLKVEKMNEKSWKIIWKLMKIVENSWKLFENWGKFGKNCKKFCVNWRKLYENWWKYLKSHENSSNFTFSINKHEKFSPQTFWISYWKILIFHSNDRVRSFFFSISLKLFFLSFHHLFSLHRTVFAITREKRFSEENFSAHFCYL